MKPVLILGCGYTGSEVARRLLKEGTNVYATTRYVLRKGRMPAGWPKDGGQQQLASLSDPHLRSPVS